MMMMVKGARSPTVTVRMRSSRSLSEQPLKHPGGLLVLLLLLR